MDPNEFSWAMHDSVFMPIKTTFGPTHDGSMLKYVKFLTRGRKIHVVQWHVLVEKTVYNLCVAECTNCRGESKF